MSGEKTTARPLRLLGRFLRRSWQGLLIGLLAVALGVAAYLSPGLVEADVRLDEGNVYAIKRDTELVGTVNSQIKQLSNAAPIGDPRTEVLQSGDQVLLFLPQSSSLVPYDAARNITGATTQLPPNARVQLVGDRLLVVGAESGAIWSGGVGEMLSLDFEKSKPQLEVGDGGLATLTTDGDVIGLDLEKSALVRATEDGTATVALPFTLEPDAIVSISAVGDKAVVLDHSSSRIWVEGASQAFPVSEAEGAKLMAPAPSALKGDDGIKAIYANVAGLNAVTSDGQVSLSERIDLNPVTPIQVGDCVYGAGVSGNTGVFVRKCVGQEAQREEIKEITSEGDMLTFQANRGVVTLNDQANGTVWMVDKDMFIIRPEDWDMVMPKQEDDEPNQEGTEIDVAPDRSKDNRRPIANDDTLGARAGTSTVLNILDNDTDPDGDVLTITTSTKLDGATLQPVRDGAGLQISISPDVKVDQFTFEYTISDGRQGTDTATAVVRVMPADITAANGNSAPRKSERPGGHKPVDVTSGSKLTKRVLLDWRDPDGDPLMLKNAWLEQGSEDILTFTPDGSIEFIDVGKSTGPKKVNVTVSDSVAETTDELILNVTEDPVAPIAYGDFVTTKVGSPVQVEPLANDQVTRPTLSEVTPPEDCADCKLDANYREKTFTFTAQKAGTYYATYTVVDGQTATGVVRIDVRGDRVTGLPVAAQDVALLPLGGTVVLDPLLNDTDPNGDVLVVQTYDAPDSLEVVMERRHRMTIRAKHDLSKPVTFTYWISNGQNPVEGKITVVPTDTGSATPIPVPDQIRIRAGSTASVNPLVNDTSPVGLDLHLGELSDNPFKDRAWIDEDRVRISVPAGTPAGVSTIGYSAVDSRGALAPSTIAVEVVPEDATNVAPAPTPVVERVLAGTETRIPIPLSGIDANGDAVRLVGLATGPLLGRVTSVGEEYLAYEAFEGARGTDTFSYEVVDAHGERGIGEVRVGVAPLSKDNSKPVAMRDSITVRPGRPVQISAIDNDFDADGDAIGYTPGAPIEMDADIKAEIVDDREIRFAAPDEPGTYAGAYSVQDSRGEQSYGQLLVEVDEDAPNLAPVARDDSVPLSSLLENQLVKVDPLANDYDPDGPKEDLRVEVADPPKDDEDGARVDEAGKLLTIPVREELQQVRYVLIDGDGQRSNGVVTVPGTNNLIPSAKNPDVPLEPTAGQPSIYDVNELVQGTKSRQVRLTTADHIWAPNAEVVPVGESKIQYVADPKFSGPASLVFEVQDKVANPNDKTGKTAVVSLPVQVKPADTGGSADGDGSKEDVNQPPELQVRNPRLEVGAGEEKRSLNLLSLFRDPDGDPNSMVIKGQPQEAGGDAMVEWSYSANTLTASAPEKAKPGSYKELRGTVMDGREGERDFTIRIEVTASVRPTVTVKEDVIPLAVAGGVYEVRPLDNDTSHLLGDKSLTLVDARATGPGGSVSVDQGKGVVKVSLEKGRHGPFTANYTVNDATGDPNRQVTGQIVAEVRDKPGTPSTPFASNPGEILDGQVSVQYRSTGDGGSKILGAVATAHAAGYASKSAPCAANTCTVSGLKNGVAWQISVHETNEVGDSEESGLSAAFTPDAVPDPPSKPTVAYADSELTVTWRHDRLYSSPNGGSPITQYDLIRTGGGKSETVVLNDPRARSYTWKGLTNGTVYQFAVVARNESGKASNPSETSEPEYPSGTPTGDTSPVAKPINDDIGGAFEVTFTTGGVDARGDSVKKYIVTPVTKSGKGNASPVEVNATGAPSHTVRVGGMGLEPTKFTIQAVNRGPETGSVGSTGDYQIAYPQPRITKVTATPGDGSASFKLEHNVSGTPATFESSVNGGPWNSFNGSISGLTNGEKYSVRFRIQLDGLTSSEAKADVMPKSAKPPAPKIASRSLRLPDEVHLDFDDSILTNAGWDFGGYSFCTTTGNKCNSYSKNLPLTVDAGSATKIYWKYGDSGSGNYTADIEPVSQPAMNNASVLSFRFPYAQSGSCKILFSGPKGGTVEREVPASNGVVAFTDGATVPIPTPAPEGPTTEPATSAKVSCTINGVSKTYETP